MSADDDKPWSDPIVGVIRDDTRTDYLSHKSYGLQRLGMLLDDVQTTFKLIRWHDKTTATLIVDRTPFNLFLTLEGIELRALRDALSLALDDLEPAALKTSEADTTEPA